MNSKGYVVAHKPIFVMCTGKRRRKRKDRTDVGDARKTKQKFPEADSWE